MLNKPGHCNGCILAGDMCGYVPASGDGSNGVLVVAEAAGEHEALQGMPLVGKAGYYLWQNLLAAGIERDGFMVHNVLSCRPPDNKLAKMSYEAAAIEHCRPLLDATIQQMQGLAKASGKAFTIVTLGNIAFKRVMGFEEGDAVLKGDFYAYPFWSHKYKAYVFAAPHPSFLMRGNHNLLPVLQYTFQRALETAAEGLTFDEPYLLCDPTAGGFETWIKDFERNWDAAPSGDKPVLSFDIETAHKQGKDEEKVSKEEDDDYTILRCSFSYRVGEAISVIWNGENRALLERLFAHPCEKMGWNSTQYDVPRITHQMPIAGDIHDGMLMWHVLNSALPKGLGFVAPYYAKRAAAWKYLSSEQPAEYNALDAERALQIFLGVRADLKKTGLWKVYERHVVELNRALHYMTEKGVPRDEELRKESEERLQRMLDEVEAAIQASVPDEARKYKVYKKTPKDTTGLVQVTGKATTKRCPACLLYYVDAKHFKSIGKKELKAGQPENPCFGFKPEKVELEQMLWAKPEEFKISNVSLQKYQDVLKHQAILSRKEKKITFDEAAIMRLIKDYPKDPLYPRILEFRELQKLLGTYIGVTQEDGTIRGGMEIGRDGRIHTTYTHNPSTLRLASQKPNLQNLPRPSKDKDALQNIIRNLIVAPEGWIFLARDFSGIEAVLVGYLASLPEYIRLAKRDVHSFYTAYGIYELDRKIPYNDLPQLSWDDERLFKRLEEIKQEFGEERNKLYKHLVHGANFMQAPKGAAEKIFKETGINHPVKTVGKVMGVYFELFPGIKKWHNQLLLQTERDRFVRNPFGYVHRFNKVFSYHKVGGKWQKEPGDDANKAIAFGPQSTAAAIIKEAILRLYYNRFEEAGQYLRLQVHDEILCECPEGYVEQLDAILTEEMERPIPELRMPASWKMGEFLSIGTESKKGKRWGQMK